MSRSRRSAVVTSINTVISLAIAIWAVSAAIYGIGHGWRAAHITLLFVVAALFVGGIIARFFALKRMRRSAWKHPAPTVKRKPALQHDRAETKSDQPLDRRR